MLTCTRRLQFCSGHRVLGHEGKCANMHGHNYVAFFHARMDPSEANELDSIGRVIDFSVLKEKIGDWIDMYWDHGFIHVADDRDVADALSRVHGQKLFVLPTNPTAENMANHLLKFVCPSVLIHTGVEVFKVVLWETENCFAEAAL